MNNIVIKKFEKISTIDLLRKKIDRNGFESRIISITKVPESVKSLIVKTLF